MKSISTILSFDEDGRPKISIESSSESKPRDKKGNSLLYSTRDFTAIDLETTGNSPLDDDIIEVGAIRYRDGKAVAQFQELVNPGYKVPPFISDMTGISDDMLQEARRLKEVLPEFLDFIGDDIVLGHNVHFDVNFIYDACINCELPPFSNDLIDTLRISRLLHKDWQSHRLCDIACGLDINSHGWHRSLCDCDVAARCYLKMMDENPDFCEKKSHKKALKISGITANVDKINESSPLFGKTCVFTGALTISREEAMQIAVNCGAVVKSGVSKNTDYLIMGDQDIRRVGDDEMSSKEEKARALNEAGDANIVFLRESDFLQMATETKSKTADQVSLFEPTDIESLVKIITDTLNEQIEENGLAGLQVSFSSLKSAGTAKKYSVTFFDNVVVRIYSGKKKTYLELPNYGKFRIDSDNDFVKLYIDSLKDIPDHIDDIKLSCQYILDGVQKDFSCCGRYMECSDAKICTNPDKEAAVGCYYRRVLHSGRVFYGANRNIE